MLKQGFGYTPKVNMNRSKWSATDCLFGGDGYKIQSFVQERSIKNGMGACLHPDLSNFQSSFADIHGVGEEEKYICHSR